MQIKDLPVTLLIKCSLDMLVTLHTSKRVITYAHEAIVWILVIKISSSLHSGEMP